MHETLVYQVDDSSETMDPSRLSHSTAPIGAEGHLLEPLTMKPEQNFFDTIRRSTLSHEVRRQILERITDGRLPGSTRVAEAQLAIQLGVSRTPLHEAMVSLSGDGLVEPLGRKGWMISPLTETGVREIYPVLAAMECLALKTAGSLVLSIAENLRELTARTQDESLSPVGRLGMEREWHRLLRSQCPNRTLVRIMEPLAIRASRYEMACLRLGAEMLPSEFSAVVSCIENKDVCGACRCIEIHWRDRGEHVASWISRLEPLPGHESLPTSA